MDSIDGVTKKRRVSLYAYEENQPGKKQEVNE